MWTHCLVICNMSIKNISLAEIKKYIYIYYYLKPFVGKDKVVKVQSLKQDIYSKTPTDDMLLDYDNIKILFLLGPI